MVDNPIYNAHTMLVDTLWAGAPVLTWYDGVDMGGRVGRR
jgi:predicted O-linked N-acetylglucosamine transferase (SPINDLY family)